MQLKSMLCMPKMSAIYKSSLAILLCSFLVWLSNKFIDKPVALWAHQNQLKNFHEFVIFIHVPELIIILVMGLYPLLMLRFCLEKFTHSDRVLLGMANSVGIAYFLHDPLKVLFGRYSPKVFMGHYKLLLNQHLYGFNFFHIGSAFSSFPSGHTTVTVSAMTMLSIVYPQWRGLGILISSLVMIALVVTNYHFVGDVIAGAFLGAFTAYFTALYMGLVPSHPVIHSNSE